MAPIAFRGRFDLQTTTKPEKYFRFGWLMTAKIDVSICARGDAAYG
jgi:hypothetical protein